MLVTVVIPSYNHAQYVAQAIESVLDQNWPDIDLIVIDDGSTDGSRDVIENLHASRGGFRYFPRENKGLIKTLNEGLSFAQGEFFCELASDDYLPEDSLKLRAEFLLNHPECVAVFADGWTVLDETETGERIIGDKRRSMFAAEDPIQTMLEGVLPVFSTGMIRLETLKQVGGFDEVNFRYYEDLDTPVLLALAGSIGFLDAPLIYRRQHNSNVSGTTYYVRLEKINYYKKLLKHTKLFDFRSLVRRQLYRSYLALARVLPHCPDEVQKEGRQILQEAWQFILREPRLLWYLLKNR